MAGLVQKAAGASPRPADRSRRSLPGSRLAGARTRWHSQPLPGPCSQGYAEPLRSPTRGFCTRGDDSWRSA